MVWARPLGNPDLREMIDLPTADGLLATAAMAVLALAVVLLIVGLVRGKKGLCCLRWAGALAPWSLVLTYGWRVFLWRVRFDPETGFLGLESVRVLALNAAVALALGLAYGVYLRWLGCLPEGGSAGKTDTQEA